MSTRINLQRVLSDEKPRILLENSDFTVMSFRYDSGVEGLKAVSSRGHLVILPWVGQMIWDAQFDGRDLTMCNTFRQPKPAIEVIKTCGCPAFHPGLSASGCPPAENIHLLHGEMVCAAMDEARLELDKDMLCFNERYEYVMGFGHYYLTRPIVVLRRSSTLSGIEMVVTNLVSIDMPLQYMCHMSYAYISNATFSQNIPNEILRLRESVPSYVNPTTQWLVFNQRAMQGEASLSALSQPEFYDSKIVFFADKLDTYTDQSELRMISLDGATFATHLYNAELNYMTCWVLYDGEQQVVAFALPATYRSEGYPAVQRNGTLIQVAPRQTRTFTATTGAE